MHMDELLKSIKGITIIKKYKLVGEELELAKLKILVEVKKNELQ